MLKKIFLLVIILLSVAGCKQNDPSSATINRVDNTKPTIEQIKQCGSESDILAIGGKLVDVKTKKDGTVIKSYIIIDNEGKKHTMFSVFNPLG